MAPLYWLFFLSVKLVLEETALDGISWQGKLKAAMQESRVRLTE